MHYLNANYSDEKNTNIAMSIKTFTEVSIYNVYDKLLVITWLLVSMNWQSAVNWVKTRSPNNYRQWWETLALYLACSHHWVQGRRKVDWSKTNNCNDQPTVSEHWRHKNCNTTPWVKKKQDNKLLPITSPNINRFSKFFHC